VEARHWDADKAAAGGTAEAAESQANQAPRDAQGTAAGTWHTATGAATEGTAGSQTASDMVREMAGSERVVDV
jgi:hypothetical protein